MIGNRRPGFEQWREAAVVAAIDVEETVIAGAGEGFLVAADGRFSVERVNFCLFSTLVFFIPVLGDSHNDSLGTLTYRKMSSRAYRTSIVNTLIPNCTNLFF